MGGGGVKQVANKKKILRAQMTHSDMSFGPGFLIAALPIRYFVEYNLITIKY